MQARKRVRAAKEDHRDAPAPAREPDAAETCSAAESAAEHGDTPSTTAIEAARQDQEGKGMQGFIASRKQGAPKQAALSAGDERKVVLLQASLRGHLARKRVGQMKRTSEADDDDSVLDSPEQARA